MSTPQSATGSPQPPSTHDVSHLSADHLFDDLAARYDLVEKAVSLGTMKVSLLCVRDTNRLVDAIDPVAFTHDERLPYWADLWASSVGLAEWCLASSDLRGKHVLELGCGLGLAGIASALAGASVLFTDYEDDALAFARYNAIHNLSPDIVSRRVRFQKVDWRTPGTVDKMDVVIAADVAYERRNFSPLLSLIDQVLLPGGLAIVADPDRSVGREFLARAGETRTVSIEKRTVTMNSITSTIVLATLRPSVPLSP